jgi:hypothetical protein
MRHGWRDRVRPENADTHRGASLRQHDGWESRLNIGVPREAPGRSRLQSVDGGIGMCAETRIHTVIPACDNTTAVCSRLIPHRSSRRTESRTNLTRDLAICRHTRLMDCIAAIPRLLHGEADDRKRRAAGVAVRLLQALMAG